jgi:hypothetical protein
MAILNSVTNLNANIGSANYYRRNIFPIIMAGGTTIPLTDAWLPDDSAPNPTYLQVPARSGRLRIRMTPASGGTVQLGSVRGTDGTNTVLLFPGGPMAAANTVIDQVILFHTDLYLTAFRYSIAVAGGTATTNSYVDTELIWSV